MDDKFRRHRRRTHIQAVHWNGGNHDEVREFFADCGMAAIYGPYFDSPEDVARDGYNVVTAHHGDDDFEADQGRWITFDGEDYETWDAGHFEDVFDCS